MNKLWNFVYLYLGVGHVYHMIMKPENWNGQKPSNFFLWLIGIHFGILGFAYQRYENHLTRRENYHNSLIEQIGGNYDNSVIQLMYNSKERKIPSEPELWPPGSVYSSLMNDETYSTINYEVDTLIHVYVKNSKNVALNIEYPNSSIETTEDIENFVLTDSRFRELHVHSKYDKSKVYLNNSSVDRLVVHGVKSIKKSDFLDFGQRSISLYNSVPNHLVIRDFIGELDLVGGAKNLKERGQFDLFIKNSVVAKLYIFDSTDYFLENNIIFNGVILGQEFETDSYKNNVFINCNILLMEEKIPDLEKNGNIFINCQKKPDTYNTKNLNIDFVESIDGFSTTLSIVREDDFIKLSLLEYLRPLLSIPKNL